MTTKTKAAGIPPRKARKFYRTEVKIVILSEQRIAPQSLRDIAYLITEGPCSGEWDLGKAKVLTGPQAAEALIEQGSDAEFFELTEAGLDTEDPASWLTAEQQAAVRALYQERVPAARGDEDLEKVLEFLDHQLELEVEARLGFDPWATERAAP